jgi:phosphohistidine phosphatase
MAKSSPKTHSVKYLWLLRHAKATPHGRRGGNDYDRPLTTRGRRDALALGNRLAAGVGVFGLDGVALPQIVLTSSAARTSETAALVAEGMAVELPIDGYRSLYQAGTETIAQYVREIDDEVISAMVVGHNPTIYRLAWELLPTDGGGTEESAESLGSGSSSSGKSGKSGSESGSESGSSGGSSGKSGSGGGSDGGSAGPDGREQLKEHGFSTCTVAVMVLPVASWSEVTEESASLAGVFSPPY